MKKTYNQKKIINKLNKIINNYQTNLKNLKFSYCNNKNFINNKEIKLKNWK